MSVDMEAIRARLNSDDPTWDRADARTLCDEVERLRATEARVDEALQMLWEEGLAGDPACTHTEKIARLLGRILGR